MWCYYFFGWVIDDQNDLCLTHFGSPPVRRASANVVSIIAKYAVPAGEWPDLLPFLFQCSQSAQEEHREVCYHPVVIVQNSFKSSLFNYAIVILFHCKFLVELLHYPTDLVLYVCLF